MLDLPEPGLYRTTSAMPGQEQAIPAGSLIYLGEKPDGSKFVVRPGQNRNNRWYWGEPTTALRSPSWAKSLKRLPTEGFYTLPDTLEFEGGGRWVKNAVVQLGYDQEGNGIIFVAERRESETENILRFSDRGRKVDDQLLDQLQWAPILPVKDN